VAALAGDDPRRAVRQGDRRRLASVDEVLEMERVALCGERYERLADRRRCVRAL